MTHENQGRLYPFVWSLDKYIILEYIKLQDNNIRGLLLFTTITVIDL